MINTIVIHLGRHFCTSNVFKLKHSSSSCSGDEVADKPIKLKSFIKSLENCHVFAYFNISLVLSKIINHIEPDHEKGIVSFMNSRNISCKIKLRFIVVLFFSFYRDECSERQIHI